MVTERVRVEDGVPARDWFNLISAVDIVSASHMLRRPDLTECFVDEDVRSKLVRRWAQELYDGLVLVGRWKSTSPLDDNMGNFGLTRDRRAVWVDFGV